MTGGQRSTPTQLRRSAWIVVAIAAAWLAHAGYRELDYRRLRAVARPVDATITRVDVIRATRNVSYEIAYRIELDGRTYAFDNKGDPDKLEELYTATWNAFEGPDAVLGVGKRFGLLVDPRYPARHRPDRDALQLRWLLWLRDGVVVTLLSAVACALLLWARRESLATGERRQHAREV